MCASCERPPSVCDVRHRRALSVTASTSTTKSIGAGSPSLAPRPESSTSCRAGTSRRSSSTSPPCRAWCHNVARDTLHPPVLWPHHLGHAGAIVVGRCPSGTYRRRHLGSACRLLEVSIPLDWVDRL